MSLIALQVRRLAVVLAASDLSLKQAWRLAGYWHEQAGY